MRKMEKDLVNCALLSDLDKQGDFVRVSDYLSVARKASNVVTVTPFHLSSETAEWNSTNLGRKQDLNLLYQVCFWGRSEKQDGRPG